MDRNLSFETQLRILRNNLALNPGNFALARRINELEIKHAVVEDVNESKAPVEPDFGAEIKANVCRRLADTRVERNRNRAPRRPSQ